MEKHIEDEFLGALWCALNVATDHVSIMKIMNLVGESAGGVSGLLWRKYTGKKEPVLEQAMETMKTHLTTSN